MFQNAPSIRSPRFTTARCLKILVVVLLGGLFTVPEAALANQVYKACGKKWTRAASKLPQAQVAWMVQKSSAEVVRDLDGDGRNDTIVLISTPSFRTCDVKKDWSQKETTLRIEYGNGRVQLFHWINSQLVQRMALYPNIGRLLVAGVDVHGKAISKWVDFSAGPPAPSPSLLAAATPVHEQ